MKLYSFEIRLKSQEWQQLKINNEYRLYVVTIYDLVISFLETEKKPSQQEKIINFPAALRG